MAFSPLDFVKLAHRLAASAPQEVELRTAVGRLYYGLFLIARDKLRVGGRHNVHTKTIGRLRGRKGHKTTADALDELFELRKVADYELVPRKPRYASWPKNWSRAQSIASRIQPRLQKLK